MSSIFIRRRDIIALAFVHALVAGFSSVGMAAGTDDISLADIDTITILPIAFPAGQTEEDRAERFEGLYGKLDDYIYKALLRKLAMRGYVLDRPRAWSPPGDWSVETLKPLAPKELAALAPDTASYVAFLFIERLESSNQGVSSSANATVSVMILHKASGTLVWRRGGEGEFSEHLLQIFAPVGMLLTPDKHAAIETAFSKIFADLPEKPYQ